MKSSFGETTVRADTESMDTQEDTASSILSFLIPVKPLSSDQIVHLPDKRQLPQMQYGKLVCNTIWMD